MEIDELNLEFSKVKKRHIAETCFLYELTNVRKELEDNKGINIPMFLIKDQIASEAQDRVIGNLTNREYSEILEYYNKAYEGILA